MHRLTKVAWGVGVLLLMGTPGLVWGQSYVGKAYRIVDGDTIHLLRETGQIVRIELYGVDAPEWGQPYGAAAAELVERVMGRTRVRAVARDRDEDGRPLFVVSVEGRSLNEQLLRAGLAWWNRGQAPHNDQLRRLEQRAREEESGLWAQSTPVPPWKWRARKQGS